MNGHGNGDDLQVLVVDDYATVRPVMQAILGPTTGSRSRPRQTL